MKEAAGMMYNMYLFIIGDVIFRGIRRRESRNAVTMLHADAAATAAAAEERRNKIPTKSTNW